MPLAVRPSHPLLWVAAAVCVGMGALVVGVGQVAGPTRPQIEYVVAPVLAPQPATATPMPLPGRPPTPTPNNWKNYSLRLHEHGMSTFAGLDPQYVLRTLGKDRLIAIPQDDPVLQNLGLNWNKTVGTTGDALLDANHWELRSTSYSQDPTYVDWWNTTIASALAAASRWTVIERW